MKRRLLDNSFFFLAALIIAFAGLRMVLGLGVAPKPALFAGSAATLVDALQQAQTEHKVVFAFATADWCGPCQIYKRGALADPRVAAWVKEHAKPVYINIDKEQSEAAALAVAGIPATMILTPEGKMVGRIEGAFGADALIRWLDAALAQADASQATGDSNSANGTGS